MASGRDNDLRGNLDAKRKDRNGNKNPFDFLSAMVKDVKQVEKKGDRLKIMNLKFKIEKSSEIVENDQLRVGVLLAKIRAETEKINSFKSEIKFLESQ